jgi:hypothetical protein
MNEFLNIGQTFQLHGALDLGLQGFDQIMEPVLSSDIYRPPPRRVNDGFERPETHQFIHRAVGAWRRATSCRRWNVEPRFP